MIASKLHRDLSGASTAEFAIVLPLLLILLFGIIDGGRFMWEYNRAEKATQMGARFAAVTAPVASGITSADFTGVTCSTPLLPGERVCASAMPEVTCDDSACSCSGCPAGLPGTYDGAAFTNIVTRIQRFEPDVNAGNVEVIYRGSGLGYAGDPTGPDVSPLVTVRLSGLQFTPITSLLFATMNKPSFSTTLTAEDMAGSQSN